MEAYRCPLMARTANITVANIGISRAGGEADKRIDFNYS